MIGNQVKQIITPETEAPKEPPRINRLHEFDFSFNRKNAPSIVMFVLFTAFWTMIYIGNHHYGERTLKEIYKIRHDMKDVKADYFTLNAELSNKSIQSEVVKLVEPNGLKILTEPPQRIKVPAK